MQAPSDKSRVVRFGVFEVDLQEAELRKSGIRLKLQEQPFRILTMLLERPGQTVTREELQRRLWPADTFVDFDHSLNSSIKKLREVLGDDSENPRFIETLHRRGYRFIAPVDGQRAPAANPPVERRTRSYKIMVAALVGTVVILTALVTHWTSHRPTAAPRQLKERRLTATPTENAVNQGAISPDGKYLAYSDQKGMHLKLIRTGELVNIPQPEGRAPGLDNWWPNVWIPDGTKFLTTGVEPPLRVSAWVVSVLGGPPRKLRDDADIYAISPNGTLIAFGTGTAFMRAREIWLMDAQGGEPRRLISGSEEDAFFQAAWSEDGKRIAYERFRRTPDGLECSIENLDLRGSPPVLLLSDQRLCDGDIQFLWLPSGRFLYTMLEPENLGRYTNLWEIEVDARTGQPVSQPRRITNWAEVHIAALSMTSDQKQLAVSRAGSQGQVYVGELEGGGWRLKEPRRLTLDESSNFPIAWTPDSRAVLYQSNRNGTWDIFKQTLGQETAEPVVSSPDYKDWAVVSPDASWILYLSTAGRGLSTPAGRTFSADISVRVMRVPTSGGPPEFVLEGRGISGLACARSPATLCVLSEETPDQKQLIFSAFDPSSGRKRELKKVEFKQPFPGMYGWGISPDGSRLAFSQYDEREVRLQILPSAGGKAREVSVRGWNGLSRLYWAADGKGLFVTVAGSAAPGDVLLRVDLEGRAQAVWQHNGLTGFNYEPSRGVPSPDDRHLALLGYINDSNVWLLEDF